jgi:hypothetical protein
MQQDLDFFGLIQQARQDFQENEEFRGEPWQWAHELDDEGFFLFCYLVHDYHDQLLSPHSFQETVYTLNLLKHKLIPLHLEEQGLPPLEQFQIIFNLYEQLKRGTMHWDACEVFVREAIEQRLRSN